MSDNNVLGSASEDSADWNEAWAAISRLAAVRGIAVHAIKSDHRDASSMGSVDRVSDGSGWHGGSARAAVSSNPDQLARDIAEIEQASAALRRAEPALEIWRPDNAVAAERRKPRSIWILIGGIWVSTLLVVAGAIGAVVLLLG